MTTRRTGVALAAAVAAVLASACEPMSIGLTVARRAEMSSTQLTLTGLVTCTRSEPVDLFPTVTQGANQVQLADQTIPCAGSDPEPWEATFDVGPGDPELVPGRAQLELDGCTNPSDPIDEDCVTVVRGVDIVAG